jgi:DNA polymerase-1
MKNSSPIKSVKPLGLRKVCDITVETDHTYVTRGGIINHNTTSSDIKTMFVPPPGAVLLEVDYSQAELRVVAEWANEPTMLEWFRVGRNIHVASACRANKCEDRYDEILKITKDESHPEHVFWTKRKKRAKTINFGILYEQSPAKLKETLEKDGEKVSLAEAEKYMADWFEDFPRIKRFIDRQHKFVKKHGYVKTLFGQKRRLPGIYSRNYGEFLRAQRQSSNTPIQGTAAQYGTFSSTIIHHKIREGKIVGVYQEVYNVHDSLGFYVDPKYIHTIVPQLTAICANPDTKKYFGFKLKKVNMQVNAEVGKNWGSLKGYHKEIDYTKPENL